MILVENLIKKVRERRKALGFSLRKLSTKTGVSFATLSRLERNEGTPDNNTLIRLVSWLDLDPKEAQKMGLEDKRFAPVHFRTSKNIDSQTIEALIEASIIMKKQSDK